MQRDAALKILPERLLTLPIGWRGSTARRVFVSVDKAARRSDIH